MTFGYIADFATGNHNHMGIRQHAESLLLNLNNLRQMALRDRPLVFVCHSLGGLVTKEALILDSRKELERQVLEATKLIVFLGTPHRGSYMLGSKTVYVLEKLAKVAFHKIPSKLKPALKVRSDELFERNEDFTVVKRDIQIVNFYEQKDMKILGELVVDKDSAVLHYEKVENIPLYRDHRELIRFDSGEDDAYRQIYQTIGRKLSSILKLEVDQTTQEFRVDLSQTCLESFGSPGSENRLTEILEPSEHTFEWLWKRETMFTHWLAHGQGAYWISGKPGSGKSVLMKEISSGIQNQYMRPDLITVRHFFNSRGTPMERSFEGFLRSILKQILRQAPALFECTIDRFREQYVSWGFGIYFKQLCDRGKTIDMKIYFSTRYIPDGLLSTRAESHGFVLQEKNSDNFARFVDDRWTSTKIKNEIIAKADGVFLWVNIVLSKMEVGIEDGNSIAELRESLNSILVPRQSTLSEMNTMLSLVLCATRPLTLTEFRCAMAFSRDQGLKSQSTMHSSLSFIQTDAGMIKRIRSRCGALVEIKKFNNGTDQPLIVQFIQSVKDYLLSQEIGGGSHILDSDKLQAHGHDRLARACLRYLIMDELRALPSRLELLYHTDREEKHRMFAAECPLLDYSVCYWIHHCHAAGSFSSCPFEELDRFFESEDTYFDTWWNIRNWIGLSHDSSTVSAETNRAGRGYHGTRGKMGVLSNARCMGGSREIVQGLVNNGADLNAQTVSAWTVLHAAASNKSEKPLEYLLASGLEPNISDDNMTTPLHLAAANGSDEHLEMLLSAGADVSALDSGNCLALHYATSNWRILNRTEVLGTLAKFGVDVNIPACDGLSPLHIAARHGSPLLVQWLLDRGANLQAVDHEGRTVLHAAAANDKDIRGAILRILLNKGIDPNVVDESGMSPLHSVFFWQSGRFEFNLQQEEFAKERRQEKSHSTKE
ncbi:hypothetical protein BKA65DRAFT_479496 [Rhexocercosporidium sp. MPI-PUGE-AT-0058]|nr:hypothetical protein BKA65DRAFT_479496 [Rhexocercosporidium sp. MPI-PUGE-AT-0058]